MIEFKIITAPDRSQQASYQHLGRELSLGRTEGDLLLDDPQVAPLQVRIRPDGNAFVLEPAAPGDVKLNGRPVSGPVPLKEKDTLLLGRTTIVFSRLDLAPLAPPPAYDHPDARVRFAEGTKEKAILDALEILAREGQPAAAAPAAKTPKPPTPPPLPRK